MSTVDIIVQFDNEQLNLIVYEDDFDLEHFERWVRSRFIINLNDRIIYRNKDDKGIDAMFVRSYSFISSFMFTAHHSFMSVVMNTCFRSFVFSFIHVL